MSICDVYLDVNEKRFSIRDIFYQTLCLKRKQGKVSGEDIFKRPRRVNKFSFRGNYAKAGKISPRMTCKINKNNSLISKFQYRLEKCVFEFREKFSSSSSRISFRTLINKFFIKFGTHQQTSDANACKKKSRGESGKILTESHCKLSCSSEVFLFRHWFFKFHPEKFAIWKVCERYSLCKSLNLVPDSVCADYCDPDRAYRFYTHVLESVGLIMIRQSCTKWIEWTREARQQHLSIRSMTVKNLRYVRVST